MPLSSERLVSNECRVKRGHYDHERSKKGVSNERLGTDILKLMSAARCSFGEIRYYKYESAVYALVPLGIFASAMVKCIIIHAMLPDALRF